MSAPVRAITFGIPVESAASRYWPPVSAVTDRSDEASTALGLPRPTANTVALAASAEPDAFEADDLEDESVPPAMTTMLASSDGASVKSAAAFTMASQRA